MSLTRSATSFAVAVAVAALQAVAGQAAGAIVLATDAFPLRPNGDPVSTRFATVPGRSYTVTVSGVYSYNGKLGLADCGHKDDAGPAGWYPVANVWLDDRPAHCQAMNLDRAHTYSWSEPGTGAPFTFEIPTGPWDADDVGSLLVTVVEDGVNEELVVSPNVRCDIRPVWFRAYSIPRTNRENPCRGNRSSLS